MRYTEFQIYGGFYCGLCKNLGSNYGQLYRMLLSYDFTFLGLLCCAFTDTPLRFEKQRCIVHPVKKRLCLKDTKALDYTAAAAVISVYQKLCDSISDSGFIKSLPFRFIRILAKKGYKKAVRKYPETAQKISLEMKKQLELEKENCQSLDLACEPTAQIMSKLAADIPHDGEQSEIFGRFGYHLGRFVYLADAWDDIDKDMKSNNYNVLLNYSHDAEAARTLAGDNINMSLCMIAEYYGKMKLKRFREIIDNVIYLGLKSYSLPKKHKKHEEIIL